MTDHTQILWLTPDKPENISVGRSRLADHLREHGYGVTLRGTTPETLVRSLWERRAYDAVIGTTRAGAIGGVLVSSVHQIPLIVDHVDPISQFRDTHPDWLAKLVKYMENVAFTRSAVSLFVYEAERKRVQKHAPVARKTALGVDYDRFSEPTEDVLAAGREHLPADLERPITVYIGGLESLYNVEAMLQAGSELGTGSLVIAGTGSLETTVRRAAAQTDRIHYIGTIPHETVPGVLAGCDVGLSLVDDPNTLKVLEYGAAGLPVVQLDGRARDRFGDRLTYTSVDPSSIQEAIRIASSRDENTLQSFVSKFDWGEIADTYADTIEQSC
ncbi:MAG: glycosyltransferase [Halolamina sp.]